MRKQQLLLVLVLALVMLAVPSAVGAQAPNLDYDIPNGHFFTQTNGQPLGAGPNGYAITNDGGIPFWDEYQRLGGPNVLGYPVTQRFVYDGFITQAMQKMVFQWRADIRQVWFLNTFDALHDKGKDDWLLNFRQTPKPFDTGADAGLSWEQVVSRHQAFLDQNEAIKAVYFADPYPIDHYGLPVSYADQGNSFVIRAQRATFQYWKEDVPWAKKGEVSVANGGDLAKEAGLWPFYAVTPESQPQLAGAYRAKSPEYGMIPFLIGSSSTTMRDIVKIREAGFNWQKSLFQWYWIEHDRKGAFNWGDTDRVVQTSNALGVNVIARMDFPPDWARADKTHNGPPDNYQDFADFVYAVVDRYKTGSPNGRVHAVELWNEANLAREWGNRKPNAAEYVRLLKAGYEAAKRADPNITVIGASLTPTGTYDDNSTPDDIFLQQMYDAGGKAYFDVLGAHGAGYKAPPSMSPDQVAADPAYGGHRIFTFRRVEDLRNVMVRNGDGGKQIWLTEMGWTSDPIHPAYAWHQVTEEQKAQYLVDAYRWAKDNWSPWIGVMTLWNIPDPTWGQDREEYWWSIANPDGSDRPAYSQLKTARQNGTLP